MFLRNLKCDKSFECMILIYLGCYNSLKWHLVSELGNLIRTSRFLELILSAKSKFVYVFVRSFWVSVYSGYPVTCLRRRVIVHTAQAKSELRDGFFGDCL